MPRRKKIVDETEEQKAERLLFEQITGAADRAKKTGFVRHLKKMDGLLEKIKPVEEKILDIISNEKQPILDEIQELRTIMMHGCPHPFEYLVQKDGYIECKFCSRKIGLPGK